MKSLPFPLASAALIVLLAGCAGSVPNEKGLREEAARAAQQSGRSAAQALAQVDADIAVAKQEGLLFYAPRHMKLAIDALETARKMQRGNLAERAQLETILTAETALKRARETEKLVMATLQPAFKFHAELVQLQTHKSLPDDYLNSLADLNELIDKVESGKAEQARRDQADYLKQLQQLEISTHLKQQLQRARDALQEADKLDSDDNTPQSLLVAQQSLATAENTIQQAPRHYDAMNKAGFVAWQEAQHVLALNQEMQQLRAQLKLSKIEGEEFEKLLLQQERYLSDQFSALSLPPQRYLSPSAQAQQLTQWIKLLRENQPITYQTPAHIDLRFPSHAIAIEKVLPQNYTSWIADSPLNNATLMPTAAAITINAPATVQTVVASDSKAEELPASITPATMPTPPVVSPHDEDELQKAIAEEQKK